MTTFAKGLMSGTIQAPAKTSWWPRHMRALNKVLASSGAKSKNSSEALIELEAVAKEWDNLCPMAARHGLMLEHAMLEVALIDAVRKNNVEEIETIGKKLYDNAVENAAVLGISIQQFPEEQFKKLLSEHVALHAGCVRKKMEGVKPGSPEMESNIFALADLSAEWL